MCMSTEHPESVGSSPIRPLVRYVPEGPEILRLANDVEVTTARIDRFRVETSSRFPHDQYGTHRSSLPKFETADVVHVPRVPDRGVVATGTNDGDEGSIDDAILSVDRAAPVAAESVSDEVSG